MQINCDDRFKIYYWMLEDLRLSGTELLVFAIIFEHFFKNNEGFIATNSFFIEWTHASKRSVITAINSLVEKELIVKEKRVVNKVELNYYCLPQDIIDSYAY